MKPPAEKHLSLFYSFIALALRRAGMKVDTLSQQAVGEEIQQYVEHPRFQDEARWILSQPSLTPCYFSIKIEMEAGALAETALREALTAL